MKARHIALAVLSLLAIGSLVWTSSREDAVVLQGTGQTHTAPVAPPARRVYPGKEPLRHPVAHPEINPGGGSGDGNWLPNN